MYVSIMPSENLRWDTLDALKNSTKGKLKYSSDWLEKEEDVLAGFTEISSLSPLSGQILKKLSPRPRLKTCSLVSSVRDTSPSFSEDVAIFGSVPISPRPISSPISPIAASLLEEEEDEEKDKEGTQGEIEDVRAVGVSSAVSVNSPPAMSLLSPRATQVAGCIRMCEEKHRARAKAELSLRQEQQEHLVATVAGRGSEQLKRFDELMALKQRQELQGIMDMMEKETQESIGRQEKLREDYKHRMKILNLRLREAEQQRVREVELERQRQTEGRERLRTLNDIQEKVLQLNQNLQPSPATQTGPIPNHASYITSGNQLCSQVSEVVRTTTEGEYPSVVDMAVAEQALQAMMTLVGDLQDEKAQDAERRRKEDEEEEKRKKQAELEAQLEEQRKKTAALSAKEKTRREGLQMRADNSTLVWCIGLQDLAKQCAESFEELNSKDKQTKNLKMDLQKAATIPVSQIGSTSGSQLKEIFEKIDKLLSGRTVMSGGKNVCASHHRCGQEFINYKLAEKFVKQGEEEVASNHLAAFPIAVVASGVWELHPHVGELILAHLHKKCPFSVPYYPPKQEGMSVEEHRRILGYRVEDSKVEEQDSFLKRMSGMIRLYAAIIQSRWPHTNKQGSHPHGLNHGWRWLAQTLNMEPIADVTATMLFDFLEVCGNALMRQYRNQFWKLLLLIKEEYFPRIEAITKSGQMGSVTRLKQFLENSLRTKQISPPTGQLDHGFWRS